MFGAQPDSMFGVGEVVLFKNRIVLFPGLS
jgi:hypothetical protein